MHSALITVYAILLSVVTGLATCGDPHGAGIHARLAWSEERGLRVVEVPESSTAARAGLRPGDRVIAIDGEDTSPMTLIETVERLRGRAGSSVELEISRDGERQQLRIIRAPYDR